MTPRPAFAAAAGLAAALAMPAAAEDWYYVAGTRTTNHFVDLDSVSRVDKTVKFRWQIISDDALKVRRHFVTRSEADCLGRIVRDLGLEAPPAESNAAERPAGDQLLAGPRGTIVGTLVDFVCAAPADRRAIKVAPRGVDAVADDVNASRAAR